MSVYSVGCRVYVEGLLKFGCGRDVPLGVENDLYKYMYQFVKKKVTHSYTVELDFGPNFDQGCLIFSMKGLLKFDCGRDVPLGN